MGNSSSNPSNFNETKKAIYHFIHPTRAKDLYPDQSFSHDPRDFQTPSTMVETRASSSMIDTTGLYTVPFLDSQTKAVSSSIIIECDIVFALLFHQVTHAPLPSEHRSSANNSTKELPVCHQKFLCNLSALIKQAEEVDGDGTRRLSVFRHLKIIHNSSADDQVLITTTFSFMLENWRCFPIEAFQVLLQHVGGDTQLREARIVNAYTQAPSNKRFSEFRNGCELILFEAASISLSAAQQGIATYMKFFDLLLDYDFELKNEKRNILHHLALFQQHRSGAEESAETQQLHDMLTSLISSGKVTPDMLSEYDANGKTQFTLAIQSASKVYIAELIASKMYFAEDFETGLLTLCQNNAAGLLARPSVSEVCEIASLLLSMPIEDKIERASIAVRMLKNVNIPIDPELKTLLESKGIK